MPRETVPFLLYVPGFAASRTNSAVRVAELIADHSTNTLAGTFTSTPRRDAREFGGLSGASVGRGGKDVLHVVQVPYSRELAGEKSGDGKGGSLRELGLAARFALSATGRLLLAVNKKSKTARAKWQLLYGLFLVFLLYASLLLTALAVLVAWNPPWLPDWLPEWFGAEDDKSKTAVAATGGVFGALFLWARPRLLRGGRSARHLMQYLSRALDRREVVATLGTCVDRLLEVEENRGATIHVLGYSFGSIIALDALTLNDSDGYRRRLAHVSTLVTVGCPVDFIRMYYPQYYAKRTAPPADIEWLNLYFPRDVLGSNFRDSGDGVDDADDADEADDRRKVFTLDGFTPDANIAVELPERARSSFLRMDGLSVHSQYWRETGQTSHLDHAMPIWPPVAGDASATHRRVASTPYRARHAAADPGASPPART